MKTTKLFLLLFAVFVSTASFAEKIEKDLTTIKSDEESLFFFVPEDVKQVYIYVSDEEDHVFQKVKIYQRGNGYIVCDKSELEDGQYFYSLYADGKKLKTEELLVNHTEK